MKNRINQLVNAMNWKLVLIFTAIFVVMLYVIDYSVIGVAELERITAGATILDMQHGYSVDFAYGMFEKLGEVGRNFYLTKILPTDIFFPISMMLFNASLMCLLLKKASKDGSIVRYLCLLPVIDMMLDWTENIGFAAMLINYPEKLVKVCQFSSFITHCKFTSVLLIYVADLLLLLYTFAIKVKKPEVQ